MNPSQGRAELVGVEVVLDEDFEDDQGQVVVLRWPARGARRSGRSSPELDVEERLLDVDRLGVAAVGPAALEVLAGLPVGPRPGAARAASSRAVASAGRSAR